MSTRFSTKNCWIGLAAAASVCFACTPARPQQRAYPVEVLIEREPGVPSPGVGLEASGKLVSRTDVLGRARLEFLGPEGATIPVMIRCPAEDEVPQPLNVRLLTLAGGATPRLHGVCAPKMRRLAVVVRAARGADLPIVHHMKTLAVTDSVGVAHVVLEGTPGDSFELTLDTAAHPELRPQNPGAFFTIAAEDDLADYDTEFTVKAPPVVRRALAKAPKGPVRIH